MRILFFFLLVCAGVVRGDDGSQINGIYAKRLDAAPRILFSPSAIFTYWGGPLIPNVQVVMVQWGAGTYAPYITQVNVTQCMSSFYTEVVRSSWIDWLSEYNSNTQFSPGRDYRGLWYGVVCRVLRLP